MREDDDKNQMQFNNLGENMAVDKQGRKCPIQQRQKMVSILLKLTIKRHGWGI